MMIISRYITRMAIFVACLLSMGTVVHAENILEGLSFEKDVLPIKETDRSDSYQPTASRMVLATPQAQPVDGLALAEDVVLFNQGLASQSDSMIAVKKEVPSKVMSMGLLASEGLMPEDNVVSLKTANPAPPAPVFWFARSPLAIADPVNQPL